MNWIERVAKWRRLPAGEKLLRRWESIPLDVAQSMAFERELVDVVRLRSLLAQIGLPVISTRQEASSPSRNSAVAGAQRI